MKLLLLLSICCALPAMADRWTFFYPEAVTSTKCGIQLVSMHVNGSGVYADSWEALASAKRNDPSMGSWSMVAGMFPPTLKGRHQAEKVCSRWLDESAKRIAAARGKRVLP
jgi:hypothetical protein